MMLDRISPTNRPQGKPGGSQKWRSLLFMHWPVPVDMLRSLVPDSLELDLWNGTAYVGVVPFEMHDVRPKWLPSALAFRFLETNVRTYVYSGDRPGVYFFSLEAASGLAVWVARNFWGLPYYHANMSVRHEQDVVHYQSIRRSSGARHQVSYRVGEHLGPSQPESLEFFFLERYLLFVERDGQLYSGQVYHRPYPASRAEVLALEDDLLLASGFDCGSQLPEHVHYSSGVDVEIFDLARA